MTTATRGGPAPVTTVTREQNLTRMAAIADRDWRVFVSYRMQMVMRVFSGASMVVGLFFMDRLVGDSAALGPYSGRYFEFALIGVVFMAIVQVGLRTFGGTLANEQRAGTLEVLLATPTRIPTLLAGMFVFPLVSVGLNMVVYVITAVVLLGARFQPSGIPAAAVLLVLTLAVFCAVGGLSASVIVLTKRGDPIGPLVAQIAMLLGGAVFPVTVLPDWLATIARLLPPYYALEGMRATLISGAGFGDVWGEMLVLAGFAAVLLPVSLWAFGRALRTARVMGTLGNY